jgi:hypothetical protein
MTRQSGFLAPSDPPSPKYTGKSGDKTIRFKLYWKHPGRTDKDAMAETHEQITTDPEKWSKDILAWFNSTLRPHETKREFVRCEVIGEVPPAGHRWVKHSAMTKIMVGGPRSGSNHAYPVATHKRRYPLDVEVRQWKKKLRKLSAKMSA